MTQKTGRFGASGREFCLYSLEKEDIEETLQLMDHGKPVIPGSSFAGA